MSKIYQGSHAAWHSCFSIPRSHFTEKERNRCRILFSSSENAICSILLKHQEIDVQIQAFAGED